MAVCWNRRERLGLSQARKGDTGRRAGRLPLGAEPVGRLSPTPWQSGRMLATDERVGDGHAFCVTGHMPMSMPRSQIQDINKRIIKEVKRRQKAEPGRMSLGILCDKTTSYQNTFILLNNEPPRGWPKRQINKKTKLSKNSQQFPTHRIYSPWLSPVRGCSIPWSHRATSGQPASASRLVTSPM